MNIYIRSRELRTSRVAAVYLRETVISPGAYSSQIAPPPGGSVPENRSPKRTLSECGPRSFDGPGAFGSSSTGWAVRGPGSVFVVVSAICLAARTRWADDRTSHRCCRHYYVHTERLIRPYGEITRLQSVWISIVWARPTGSWAAVSAGLWGRRRRPRLWWARDDARDKRGRRGTVNASKTCVCRCDFRWKSKFNMYDTFPRPESEIGGSGWPN